METSDDRLKSTLRRALLGTQGMPPHIDDTVMAAYLAGDLAPEGEAVLRAHLASCSACGEDLAMASLVEADARQARSSTPRVDANQPRSSTPRVDARQPRSSTPRADVRRSGAGAWMRLAASILLAFGILMGARQAAIVAVERSKPALIARAEAWTDRKISLESLGLDLAEGPGIRAVGLAIAEGPDLQGPDFLTARELAIHVEPTALLSGRLDGNLAARGVHLRLRRTDDGRWNVETVGRNSDSLQPPGGPRSEPAPRSIDRGPTPAPGGGGGRVHVASVSLSDSLLEIEGNPTGPPLQVAGLRAEYRGKRGRAGRLTLTGDTGAGPRSLAIEGSVGPFAPGLRPVYEFDDVRLSGVPLDALPGSPEGIDGSLRFEGSLFGAGRSLTRVVAGARGTGWLELCCGEVERQNLVRKLLYGLARLPADSALPPDWRSQPELQSILSEPSTAYGTISAAAELDTGVLRLSGLEVDTAVVRLDLDATIEAGGRVEAEGNAILATPIARVLTATAPWLSPFAEETPRVQIPIVVRGTWPALEVRIDPRALAARYHPSAQTPLLLRLVSLPRPRF